MCLLSQRIGPGRDTEISPVRYIYIETKASYIYRQKLGNTETRTPSKQRI